MDRREFLKLCSVAGLGVVGSQVAGTKPVDAAPFQTKKMVIMMNCGGGWDHTLFTTPKGDTPNSEGWSINDPLTSYGTADILTAGNIDYPPVGLNTSFYNQWHQYMTVFRGIDMQTNGHDAGQRHMWSGRLPDNSPCFAALYAAVAAGEAPLAFITNGGYDSTFGVPVSKTRLGNTDALFPLIYPNRQDPEEETSALFHSAETFKRILATRQARLDRMRETQNLPSLKRAMGLLYTSRLGMEELKKINEYISLIEDNDPNGLGNGLERQGKIALAAYKAGLSAVATMSMGGYDTHSNNDVSTIQRLTQLVQGVDATLRTAVDILDLANEVVVVVGSDFGRTPQINGGMGRDHWSVGGNMVIDLSGEIPGNRVVGDTDEFLRYKKINPNTLAEDPSGVAMKPGHIHRWLRHVTGIEDSDIVKLFPTQVDEFIDFSQAV
jgi:Protein of unknown function (DUF1501)